MRAIFSFFKQWWWFFPALIALLALSYGAIIRPWYVRWGATDDDLAMTLPGDELIPDPSMSYTRGISIEAPPEAIWPWLAQIGQDRGGFYSYDALENLVGCQIHSADRVHSEWQDVQPGDLVPFGPNENYPAQTVIETEPNRYLLLWGGAMAEDGVTPVWTPLEKGSLVANATWLFYLDPQPDGPTRLIVRAHNAYSPGLGSFLVWQGITEPLNFFMEQKMMRSIRNLAEQAN